MMDLTRSIQDGDFDAVRPLIRAAMRRNDVSSALDALKALKFEPALLDALKGTREGVAVLYELGEARHAALRTLAREVFDGGLGEDNAECPDRHDRVLFAPFYLSGVAVHYDVMDVPCGRLMLAVQATRTPRVLVHLCFENKRYAAATRTRLGKILPESVEVKQKDNPWELTRGGWRTRMVYFELTLSGTDEESLRDGLTNIGAEVLRPILGFWRWLDTKRMQGR